MLMPGVQDARAGDVVLDLDRRWHMSGTDVLNRLTAISKPNGTEKQLEREG